MTGAPYNFATFLASIMLVKNPDDFGRNMLFTFSHGCRLHSAINLESDGIQSNRFWGRCNSRQIPSQPFVIPEKSFKENYKRIDSYMRAAFQSGGTYPETIATWFAQEFKSNPDLIDELKNYPVITIISDQRSPYIEICM